MHCRAGVANDAGFLFTKGNEKMSLRSELEPFAATGREAFPLIADLFTGIVAALRRDCRFSDIRVSELELLLADVRADAERRLFRELHHRVHLDHIDHAEGGTE
jgi:hypothetical protein